MVGRKNSKETIHVFAANQQHYPYETRLYNPVSDIKGHAGNFRYCNKVKNTYARRAYDHTPDITPYSVNGYAKIYESNSDKITCH